MTLTERLKISDNTGYSTLRLRASQTRKTKYVYT